MQSHFLRSGAAGQFILNGKWGLPRAGSTGLVGVCTLTALIARITIPDKRVKDQG